MKIISYSIFGKEQIYRKCLLHNIEIAKKLFPEWKIFIHLNLQNEKKQFLKDIKQKNTEIIDLKEDHPQDGFFWRMLPMEENHDAVIVRDVDTRLFNRDRQLVDHWLASNLKFHICRDNIGSFQPILGGLWGGKKPNLKISKFWNEWKKNQKEELWDIGFLKKHIYPIIRSDLLVFTEHNIYLGEKNIIKLGPREKYMGRSIMIGMVIKEDLQLTDQEIKNNRNKERLENYVNYETSKDEKTKFIRILFPRYYFKNFFINLIYLIITFFYFLIDFKKYNTLKYVKYKFLNMIFKGKYNSKLSEFKLWI